MEALLSVSQPAGQYDPSKEEPEDVYGPPADVWDEDGETEEETDTALGRGSLLVLVRLRLGSGLLGDGSLLSGHGLDGLWLCRRGLDGLRLDGCRPLRLCCPALGAEGRAVADLCAALGAEHGCLLLDG